jgi:hypothetical protein
MISSALVVLLSAVVAGYATNVTVDDTSLAWIYSKGSWYAVSASTPCAACEAKPDPSKAYNSTWHDTGYGDSATLSFTGVSLNVYVICPGPLPVSVFDATNFTFTLDGVDAGAFNGPSLGCPTYIYNFLVFSRSDLDLQPHIFVITNAPPFPPPTRAQSSLLLDYAVYDDGSNGSTSSGTLMGSPSSTLTGSPQSGTPSCKCIYIFRPFALTHSTACKAKQPKYSEDDKIQLGVGLSLGLAMLILAVVGLWMQYRSGCEHRLFDCQSTTY